MSDWTRDAAGNFIDWTKPPYYVRGVLNLVLPGEEVPDADELAKRRGEYLQLTRRNSRRRKKDAGTAAS